MTFFVLVFGLSVPFWLVGFVTPLQLAPDLPVAALMTICPMTAAVILVYRHHGARAVAALLKRSFDFRRIQRPVWYVPILLLMPVTMLLSYGVMRLSHVPLPGAEATVLGTLALLLAFFVSALGEELGWSGYVLDPMQARWSALTAALLLGLVWAAWHVVPLMQAHRPVAWIAWWCLATVAARVLLVWLYNNTGKSVFAVALCHATQNVTWQLFPTHGSHYDPRITGLILTIMAAIVALVWGPRRLAPASDTLTDRKPAARPASRRSTSRT